MHRALAIALLALICLPATASPNASAEPYAVIFESRVAVKMRDGVTLRADIYRPAADGKFPVLLQRTPYDKNGGAGIRTQGRRSRLRRRRPGRARPLHLRGRVVPLQARIGRRLRHGGVGGGAAVFERQGRHVGRLLRGRHADARRHRPSAAPGRHLPRRDGQQLPRRTGPTRAAPSSSGSTSPGRPASRKTRSTASYQSAIPTPWRAVDALPLSSYPLFNIPAPNGAAPDARPLAPYFLDWLAHPNYDEYWKQLVDRRALRRHPGARAARSPPGTTSSRAARCGTTSASKRTAATKRAQADQHLSSPSAAMPANGRKIGDVDFGPAPPSSTRTALTLKWYDYLFKGAQNEFASDKPVQDFRHGREPVARRR